MKNFLNIIFKSDPLKKIGKNHRPFGETELKRSRHVNGKLYVNSSNPGYRVTENFISDDLEIELLKEAMKLKQDYGFISSNSQQVISQEGNKQTETGINIIPYRVTGRPELDIQKITPWKYGDNFKYENVPPSLKLLVEKVESCQEFDLLPNSLRDITINYRDQCMFKLDPHIDPLTDGNNIFVFGLKSDVVFTLSPDLDQFNEHKIITRTSAGSIALQSWTDRDVDVLLKQRDLFHFTDDARLKWKHGIRIGVDASDPYNGICDWWGNIDSLFKRNNERISIILAFK